MALSIPVVALACATPLDVELEELSGADAGDSPVTVGTAGNSSGPGPSSSGGSITGGLPGSSGSSAGGSTSGNPDDGAGGDSSAGSGGADSSGGSDSGGAGGSDSGGSGGSDTGGAGGSDTGGAGEGGMPSGGSGGEPPTGSCEATAWSQGSGYSEGDEVTAVCQALTNGTACNQADYVGELVVFRCGPTNAGSASCDNNLPGTSAGDGWWTVWSFAGLCE